MSDEELKSKNKRLTAEVLHLRKENEILTDSAEDIHLLGIVSSKIVLAATPEEVIGIAIESIALLKDLAYCAFLSISDTSVEVTDDYGLQFHKSFKGKVVPFEKTLKAIIEKKEYFNELPAGEPLPAFIPHFSDILSPNSYYIMPLYVRDKLNGIILCVNCVADSDHLRKLLPLLFSICHVMQIRLEAFSLITDLTSSNEKLTYEIVQRKQVEEKREKLIRELDEDIAERKKVEDAFQESEERFRMMMHQSPSVIELYDLDGLQVDVNSAYEDLWGFPASHTVNKFNVLKSKEVEDTGLMSYVKDAYAGKMVKVPPYKFDSTGATEGKGKGRIRWLSTRIYPLNDKSGNVKNIVITHEDISDIKFADEERKKLEQAMLDIEERERKRIGYDLHDGLGQLLTGISFKLASLVGKLKGSSKGEAEDIKDVLGVINDAKSHVAQLSRGLLPLELESEGIVEAIEKLASYAEKTLGISSAVRYSESFTINNEKAVLHLYRIAQEAVNNAVKHSNAGHIEINLEKRDLKVELSVKDDGTGIPEKLEKEKGLGLQIMKFRADIIGGSFNIQSSADEGTMVTCVFNDIT